jgi:uncharacterized protein (TIGR03435 family)
MISSFLLPVLALAAPFSFGQPGLYGPVTAHLKAGDIAPDIQYSKVLSAPGSASWSSADLYGKPTVLIFYLNTSRNLQTVTMWNTLVDQFAGKPVQFLFISGEEGATLLPWLNQHPIKGWVFHDPDGQTGKAYGLEQPATVFIGADSKIVGFGDMGFPPDARLVNAALEGRITTTRPTQATIKAFIESGQELLNAEPQRIPRPNEQRPKFPPSFTLHISSSQSEGRGNSSGNDYWALNGFTLKEVINEVYGTNPIRVLLPDTFDQSKRYDFALVLPEREDRDKMKDRFRQGIQDYFHLVAARESRLVDVYVVTRDPNHQPPPSVQPRSHEDMAEFSSSDVEFQTTGCIEETSSWPKPLNIDALRGISIDGTVDEFCHLVESNLDRPLVNETNLKGAFQFRVESSKGESNDFLERLHNQLGLIITPARKSVETLVFKSRQPLD